MIVFTFYFLPSLKNHAEEKRNKSVFKLDLISYYYACPSATPYSLRHQAALLTEAILSKQNHSIYKLV